MQIYETINTVFFSSQIYMPLLTADQMDLYPS